MTHHFDAIILGGGASGLLCAIAAKRAKPHLRVAVIEKNDRVGKKLLATGNGRCNLTHDRISAAHYAGSFRAQSRVMLERFDAARLLEYFRSLGLLTAKDGEGRYYPLCRQAAAVLDVLRFNCEALAVPLFCSQTVKSVRKQGRFTVTTTEHTFTADELVIAAGSKAAPKLGGSGSAADMLRNFGHRVVPFAPALCPLKTRSEVLKALKGLRAQAEVMLMRGGSVIKTERGEVQFNEDNLSGICVFNLSLCSRAGDVVKADLLPEISEKELSHILTENKERFSAQSADNLFTGILQKRIAQAVMKSAGITGFSRPCSALSDVELREAARLAKGMTFPVSGSADFDRAQACLGGVHGSEIDARTMRSKKQQGLFICGEAIDLCGECGGYNLHFAFASGIVAGENL